MLTTSAGEVHLTRSAWLVIYATNVGGAATNGPYSIAVELPDGMVTASTPSPPWAAGDPPSWACPPGAGQTSFTCTRSDRVYPGMTDAGTLRSSLLVPVAVETASEERLSVEVTISGGGAGFPVKQLVPVTISSKPARPGVQSMWAGAFDENGRPETRAGAHPFMAVGAVIANTFVDDAGRISPVGDLRDVFSDLPLGFSGNPLATPRCERAAVADSTCDSDAVVGRGTAIYEAFGGPSLSAPLYNVRPPDGWAAQLTFQAVYALVSTGAKLRPGDYGVRAVTSNLVGTYRPYGGFITLWGPTGAPTFDPVRCLGYDCTPVSSSNEVAFLTNPTECTGQPLLTSISIDTWQQPGLPEHWASDPSPPITDCDHVPFSPSVVSELTSTAPDSPSGLDVDLQIPQEGLLDFDSIAQSHLKDVTVEFPEGLSVNPSGAAGLEGCSDEQFSVGTEKPPTCPDTSKIAAVTITSPLVDREIGGVMYLAEPRSIDPMSGDMFRLFLLARNDKLGVMIKLRGSAVADPETGKVTATFKNNPQLPFDHLSVKLKRGGDAVLATPRECGPTGIKTTLSPWTGMPAVSETTTQQIAGDCTNEFAPRFAAGTVDASAGASSKFLLTLARDGGTQEFKSLVDVKLAKGLVGDVGSVPLCEDAAADGGSCPEGSRIGRVLIAAGAGPSPLWIPQPGRDETAVYLTGPYKGAPYGLSIVVPAQAGPYDLGRVVVRSALHVDERTAQITSGADEARLIDPDGTVTEVLAGQLPRILKGILLNQREIRVVVDREGFMINPTSCEEQQITAEVGSFEGAAATVGNRFQAAGCAKLGFKPKFRARILDRGRRSTLRSWHPRTRFTVVPQPGDANIGGARVALPSSTILDQGNLGTTCTRAQMAERNCPAKSLVGYARAWSPILHRPIEGPVYLAANGGARPLPDLAAVLDGEVRIVLQGEVSTLRTGGNARLQNTFRVVPDAPVSRFVLTMRGGKNTGLLVNSTDLCRSRERGVAVFRGQNGRVSRRALRLTPSFKGCRKVRRQAARKAARRSVARRIALKAAKSAMP